MAGNVLKVATYNANSIRARMDAILSWLAKESPDVLCVQETKVQDADFPAAPLEEAGYQVVFRGQKAHAGVAIISKDELEDVAFGIDDGEEPDEPRLIRGTIHGIHVIDTYVPQGRSPDSEQFQYKLHWFERLRALFERHYAPEDMLLWAGDFNVAPLDIDVHDPKRLARHVDFHPDARAALEQVREWGFEDVFRRLHPDEAGHYSYFDYRVRGSVDRGLGWRIDHIWTTEPLAQRVTSSWIDVEARRGERPSDHTFLVAEFSI